MPPFGPQIFYADPSITDDSRGASVSPQGAWSRMVQAAQSKDTYFRVSKGEKGAILVREFAEDMGAQQRAAVEAARAEERATLQEELSRTATTQYEKGFSDGQKSAAEIASAAAETVQPGGETS